MGGAGLLPPSLVLRRDLERLPETVAAMNSEAEVRAYVADLNARTVEWIRMPHGPHVRVAPVRSDEIVADWRAAHQAPARARDRETTPATTEPTSSGAHRSWWRRLFPHPRAATPGH